MKLDILSGRYKGRTAKSYDLARMSGDKWRREQQVVRQLLQYLPSRSRVIDVPVGTGRFIDVYKEFGLQATGVDISVDMLEQARRKLAYHNLNITLEVGDIRQIKAEDNAFDCAVCIRFLNWISARDVKAVLRELSRVSRRDLIIGVRQYVPLSGFTPPYRLRNLRRMGGQLFRRLGWTQGLVFHDEETVRCMLNSLQLETVHAERIEQRWDGTDYYIYHLRRRADEPSK